MPIAKVTSIRIYFVTENCKSCGTPIPDTAVANGFGERICRSCQNSLRTTLDWYITPWRYHAAKVVFAGLTGSDDGCSVVPQQTTEDNQ